MDLYLYNAFLVFQPLQVLYTTYQRFTLHVSTHSFILMAEADMQGANFAHQDLI